jgi:hypothetical protein
MSYADFLRSKIVQAPARGFEPQPMPGHMFDFQAACVEHAIRCGSAGTFLDTGLGKTACELEYVRQCSERTNGVGLILTPLAVAWQIEREARRFGYTARVIRDADDVGEGINICNYDRLDRLDLTAFGAVALDESGIIKNFAGKTTRALIEGFAQTPYRLTATATPAPNDHMELGQHAEFCGVMKSVEMLSTFFINDTSKASQEWRLKKHGVDAFWDWMASWSRMAQSPEDLGFDGSRFVLPPINVRRVRTENSAPVDGGDLFGVAQVSATDLHRIKRQTAEARAVAAAEIVSSEPGEPWVVWCDTDYEADAIMVALGDMSGVAEVRGSHPPERKESTLAAFADGSLRVLVTKSSVCGFGLNWQHCARTVFVGRNFSYEQWYQAVRRFWRFGQTRQVECWLVLAEGEDAIGRAIDRKAGDHADMKLAMAAAMKRGMARAAARMTPYQPKHNGELPPWLFAA